MTAGPISVGIPGDAPGVVAGDHVDGLILDLGVRAPVHAQVLGQQAGGRRHDLGEISDCLRGRGEIGQEAVSPLALPQCILVSVPVATFCYSTL